MFACMQQIYSSVIIKWYLTNHNTVKADHAELFLTVATVALQMPASVTEGSDIVVSVDLSGVLEVDLVVTLSTTPGTASEFILLL